VYVLLPTEQTGVQTGDQAELVEELRRQNEYLREENRRKDHLLAAALERIPAIEAPTGEPEAPQTAQKPQEGGESRPNAPGAQEGGRRPWWRRVFGR
jgi:hypothetical protein